MAQNEPPTNWDFLQRPRTNPGAAPQKPTPAIEQVDKNLEGVPFEAGTNLASVENPNTLSATAQAKQPGSAWRRGNLLVMRTDAQLPPFCIKSNEPAIYWVEEKLIYVSPAIRLLMPLLAPFFSKRAVVRLGLSASYYRRRQAIRTVAIVWMIGSVISMVVGQQIYSNSRMTSNLQYERLGEIMMVGGLFLIFPAILFGQCCSQLLWPEGISSSTVSAKGAHPGFLDRLPALADRE